MLMTEAIESALLKGSSEFDLSLMKSNAVMEAALREYDINRDAAELKVLKENGTDDDLAYYYKEAENGLVDTIVKVIKKIKEAIIKFCSDIKSRILTVMGKKENVETINKIEKKVKYMPLLKRKKILIEDYNSEAKCSEKAYDKLNKLKVKAKAGQSVSVEDINEVKESFVSEHKTLLGVSAAITITVGAAIAAVKSMANKSASIVNEWQKRATSTCDDCIKMAEKLDNPNVAQAISDAVVEISRTSQEAFLRSYNGTVKQIKNAVRSVGKTELDVKKGKAALNMESVGALAVGAAAGAAKHILGKDDDKKEETPNEEVSEMGDDPVSDMPIGPDEEPDTDPWDDVMNVDVDMDDDEEAMLKNQSYTPTSVGESDDADDSMDDNKMKDESLEDDSINESVISQLFNDIMDEVYESEESTEESTSAYDSLMMEIENLV